MSTAESFDEFPEWTFGDRLRKARRHAGMSQAEMATAIGASTARLSNWEAGYNLPRDLVGTAEAVASATADAGHPVPAGWLLGLILRSRCFSPELTLVPAPDESQMELEFEPISRDHLRVVHP